MAGPKYPFSILLLAALTMAASGGFAQDDTLGDDDEGPFSDSLEDDPSFAPSDETDRIIYESPPTDEPVSDEGAEGDSHLEPDLPLGTVEEMQQRPRAQVVERTGLLSKRPFHRVLLGLELAQFGDAFAGLVGRAYAHRLAYGFRVQNEALHSLRVGLGYRGVLFSEDVDNIRPGKAPDVRLTFVDYELFVEYERYFSSVWSVEVALGYALQYRRLIINQDLNSMADDYQAGYTSGGFLMASAVYGLPLHGVGITGGLSYRSGQRIQFRPLRHSGKHLDLNPGHYSVSVGVTLDL